MKTKLLKYVRKHLYEYDGVWMVKSVTFFPLYTFLLCAELNNIRFYTKDCNLRKNTHNITLI